MKINPAITVFALCGAVLPAAAEVCTNSLPASAAIQQPPAGQNWNWHVQNTDIAQGYPAFSSKYSGPNSLPSGGETRETVSLDLMAGVRLWRGAEAHGDGLMWQGFGVSNTLGVDGFPNGEAFRPGIPNWFDQPCCVTFRNQGRRLLRKNERGEQQTGTGILAETAQAMVSPTKISVHPANIFGRSSTNRR